MRKRTIARIAKKKTALVYLMHRMFNGDIDEFVKTMASKEISAEEMRSWNDEFGNDVKEIIREENIQNAPTDIDSQEVPSIKVIKEKTLRRIDTLVNRNDDPARLAQVYKTLSEFESVDDKKEKTVIDAVKESIQDIPSSVDDTPISMLDVLRADGKAVIPAPAKRRPGRPRKVDSLKVNKEE